MYVLGAGFSAPLGLPLVQNFLEKSKDQYFANLGEFAYFQKVYEIINQLARIKNVYSTDLYNIEEILSLVEMQSYLAGQHNPTHSLLIDYITDVIQFHTPQIPSPMENHEHWGMNVAGTAPWYRFVEFTAGLLPYAFRGTGQPGGPFHWEATPRQNPQVRYSVVTLNYDLILETGAQQVRRRTCGDLSFSRDPKDLSSPTFNGVLLAKLHGSIDTYDIIPPTWSKTLPTPGPGTDWELAFKLLSRANHIRFIGYSLPAGDSNVRYLFQAAVARSEHLKTIHVICKDPDGGVRRRYDDLVVFPNYRFHEGDTEEYLSRVENSSQEWPEGGQYFNLEFAHNAVFGA